MKNLLNIFLMLCIVINTAVEGKRKKCGTNAENCMLLQTGEIFWLPEATSKCPNLAMCPSGYSLRKQKFGELRACCCLLKNINQCPDCDMSKAGRVPYNVWFDDHLHRSGPPDGTCPIGTYKRQFLRHGLNEVEKCCCEPKNSPYLKFY